MKNKLAVAAGIAVVILGGFTFWQQLNPSRGTAETFSVAVTGLLEAKSPETVELKNGDTYNLTASVVKKNIGGAEIKALAYNGSVPGPLIKVPQGAEITLNFQNETDVPTTLHSHGVRLENASDGVPGLTQKEIPVGGTYTYKLKFPDAGIYWYHPHLREDYAQELGLYGNYLVTPADPSYWSPANREVALFLDDILIADGRVVPFNKQTADHALMGRFGNSLLVNGEEHYALKAQKGEVIRFYVTNSASARPFRFAIAGAKLKLVGGDGGAYERDTWVKAVTLGPSERAILEVLFNTSGQFAIQNLTPDKIYILGTVNVSANPVATSYAREFSVLKTHTETMHSINSLRPYFDRAPDKRITLTLAMRGRMPDMPGRGHNRHGITDGQRMGGSLMRASPGGIEWEDPRPQMNRMSNADSVKWKIKDQDTDQENMDIAWSLSRGEPVKIRIFNDPNSMHPMQHPIHFHGQQFLVLARNGVKEADLVWKDTVLVPADQTMDILFYPTNPGTWMAHCHIAEHLEAGMMFGFTVK